LLLPQVAAGKTSSGAKWKWGSHAASLVTEPATGSKLLAQASHHAMTYALLHTTITVSQTLLGSY